MEQKQNKYRHDLGITLETNGQDGRFIIMLQADVDKPILNPETLSGKLLWFTNEPGYDYNHPYSRAKERAEKICKAYNEYDSLKAENEALKKQVEVLRGIAKRVKSLYRDKDYYPSDTIGGRLRDAATEALEQTTSVS